MPVFLKTPLSAMHLHVVTKCLSNSVASVPRYIFLTREYN